MIFTLTEIDLKHTVFVAFAGDTLNIEAVLLKMPANQNRDNLTCFDPSSKPIYSCDIDGQPEKVELILELKNLTISGEYYCQYTAAKVYWFLRVRSEYEKEDHVNE